MHKSYIVYIKLINFTLEIYTLLMQDDLQAQTVRVKQSKPIYHFLTAQFNMWFEILENYRFIQ